MKPLSVDEVIVSQKALEKQISLLVESFEQTTGLKIIQIEKRGYVPGFDINPNPELNDVFSMKLIIANPFISK